MKTLVLASKSPARKNVLAGAGLVFEVVPGNVDEDAIKTQMRDASASCEDAALALAEAKARDVAAKTPGCFVLGADQILECDGVWFDKPGNIETARRQLHDLSGHTHKLISALCLVYDEEKIWSHIGTAELTMRFLSDGFIDDYLEKAGVDILQSVGTYQLEGLGSQLFDSVEGDFFTVLGLPLMPLLKVLRQQGVVAT
ncbi:MAG: septum formation protein Maf [Rhodospirillaceae bacterium]|nr:septum formation protein Maf [Rhodospirillaceae bacterium]MBT5373063.1 septum formation protein Maf [Rhodospirillaceae bacterium]MBT5659153.1 septum formation protein Maf [Rhodospirillaceae bacterium]MBT5753179.1 septum formation protein Maf [Rhodospirillaceae bacterium]